ncbi:hypothetical protein Tco_0340629 [Tanacetum coccineum]
MVFFAIRELVDIVKKTHELGAQGDGKGVFVWWEIAAALPPHDKYQVPLTDLEHYGCDPHCASDAGVSGEGIARSHMSVIPMVKAMYGGPSAALGCVIIA